ncbi:GAB3 protein, partial [Polypterus senegalus]|nr:GRB2-associated-binding protein 3 isoform X1 [Polypterus senegalus]MBN3289943.1 GAB3 protein [Polypterus senegalus]
MSSGDIVCTGWLIKSPPEKKLKRYAWRKRWFVLRQGRMSGNPDVLEYFRSKTSKKPIRVINLNECQVQMHQEASVIRREFQDHHIFVVKTAARTFYLVAKTEAEMNTWVHHISQICHFGPLDSETDSVESLSPTISSLQRSPSGSSHTSRMTDATSNSVQDFPTDTSSREGSHSESDSSLPSDYLFLSQCKTGPSSFSNRCNSWSHSSRLPDTLVDDVFSSPGCSSQPTTPSVLSESFSLLESVTSPAMGTKNPWPEVFMFDKNCSGLLRENCQDGETPPPRPPKPVYMMSKDGDMADPVQPIRACRKWSIDAALREDIEMNHRRNPEKRFSLSLPHRVTPFSCGPTSYCDDAYVPMKSPLVTSHDLSPDGYIPMSPCVVAMPLSNGTAELTPVPSPLPKLPPDMEPPPVNRSLKPRNKTRPPSLDLRSLTTIREHPARPILTRTMTEPCNPTGRSFWEEHHHHFNEGPGSSSGGGEEDGYIRMSQAERHPLRQQNGHILDEWPGKVSLDYLDLDFNLVSPSPAQQKLFLLDEEKVDYVLVDEKKTQALQNTKQEWTDVRQSKA